MNVATLENVLNLAVMLRFVAWADRPLFVATVLSHIPLGNKVDALEDIMSAAGNPNAKQLARRLMGTVERRNKLAHQAIDGIGDTCCRVSPPTACRARGTWPAVFDSFPATRTLGLWWRSRPLLRRLSE